MARQKKYLTEEERLEAKKKYDRQYYLKHQEKMKKKAKEYAENNKEKVKERQHSKYLKRKAKKEAEKRFTVYLRTNKINGKQYIGQTDDFKRRENDWNSLVTIYANKLISKDRDEFGLKNFETDILAIVNSREEAWELEQKFIKEMDTKYPNGYNLSDGGGGSKGITAWNKGLKGCYSEETLHKMSENKKGNTPWNKGVNGCYSENTLQKMSIAKKGKPNIALMREMHQFNDEGELVKIWNSTSECRKAGFHHASEVANGKREQDKGYVFKYPKYK